MLRDLEGLGDQVQVSSSKDRSANKEPDSRCREATTLVRLFHQVERQRTHFISVNAAPPQIQCSGSTPGFCPGRTSHFLQQTSVLRWQAFFLRTSLPCLRQLIRPSAIAFPRRRVETSHAHDRPAKAWPAFRHPCLPARALIRPSSGLCRGGQTGHCAAAGCRSSGCH